VSVCAECGKRAGKDAKTLLLEREGKKTVSGTVSEMNGPPTR